MTREGSIFNIRGRKNLQPDPKVKDFLKRPTEAELLLLSLFYKVYIVFFSLILFVNTLLR
jgi:hypothetical protein